MENIMELNEILKAIRSMDLNQLSQVSEVTMERKRVIGESNVRQIGYGSKVQFIGKDRCTYTAVVTRVNRVRVVVKVEAKSGGWGKWDIGTSVTVPFVMVTAI
jgi:hypothetical protein